MGVVAVASFAAWVPAEGARNDPVYLETDQFCGQLFKPVGAPRSTPPFNEDVLSLDPAEFAQPLQEGLIGRRRRSKREITYPRSFPGRLLPTGRARPTSHSATHDRDELTPPHAPPFTILRDLRVADAGRQSAKAIVASQSVEARDVRCRALH